MMVVFVKLFLYVCTLYIIGKNQEQSSFLVITFFSSLRKLMLEYQFGIIFVTAKIFWKVKRCSIFAM